MATAEQILAVARSQIGTREAANGSNPYGKAYGMDRVAWCAQFCWWVFRQAGADALIMQKTAYTPTLADWYRQRGRFDTAPRPGDLVFYNWPDSVNRIQHVGIVESVEPAAIVTIEGNTSQGTAGSQSDGGGVWRRRRARTSSIVGYAHPAYTPAAPAASTSKTREGFLMALSDQEQAELLAIIRNLNFQLFAGEGGPDGRPGWRTWAGGTDETLTVVDLLRRNNVEVRALRAAVDRLATMAGQGGGASADQIKAAVADAIREGLVEVDVVVHGRESAA